MAGKIIIIGIINDWRTLISNTSTSYSSASNELVKNWFGSQFNDLHPRLQHLHLHGGTLNGDVNIQYGKGLAGLIGKRLGHKLHLPSAGTHHLSVAISHHSDGLHWNRLFNQGREVRSLFKPVGNKQNGYWLETTGPLTMQLTVDIRQGGWYWHCLNMKVFGLPLPMRLLPKANAYKLIEDNQYRFHVEFSLPVLGSLVCYSGLLK